MANKVLATSVFKRKVKSLLKKHKTLSISLLKLEDQLLENPYLGVNYGSNIYKIRLADTSKGKGTSGGFRIITYLINEEANSITIQLITILNKSEEDSITKKEVLDLIKKCDL
ncbi:addiction module toxin RelE [Pedobacter sp. SD-b]|uniref:Addiction module toxin RelE n=1 Tax=Pedobacter segetis TaxID=2793069 RepID=A0ABS1BIT6_9SPHI|nr:addiction module toxin RelE [Pedobacter segetis]MBK0382757.1 addiction module toxin RelE [Pedobacter segetis]